MKLTMMNKKDHQRSDDYFKGQRSKARMSKTMGVTMGMEDKETNEIQKDVHSTANPMNESYRAFHDDNKDDDEDNVEA